MPTLPSGTVTFLFTDIEGSTKRWEDHPQQMQGALNRHDVILHRAISANEGYVFKNVGDGCCAAFHSPLLALSAALDAQLALQAEQWDAEVCPLRVRMALHTGVVEARGGDYFGQPLNRVSRLLSAGHGGQVLLSESTYGLVRDNLPATVDAQDLGEHRLKDLIRPERIFQLLGPGLPSVFPPLRTLDVRRHNLPVQPTALIGREKELAQAETLLLRSDVRLVTLTGPGGTGKTRLALQLAADAADSFEHGVYFVDLAPVSEPSLVLSTVAWSLQIKEGDGQPLMNRVKDYLREKELLLLLDNFEQVVDAAPHVAEILSAAPRVKVLVTSRELLQIRGEHNFLVPPLQLPDHKHLPPLEKVTDYEGIRLFTERAVSVNPDFTVNHQNAEAVAKLCLRLDGLPLAMELAAVRMDMLTPQAMLAHLESSPNFLVRDGRDLPARQRTLWAAIAWSYDLLTEAEKRLFRRLAVFLGGQTLEAIEAVCNADGDLKIEVLEGVESLVDKSLLRPEEGVAGEPRFRMLETIREFAREKLSTCGETDDLRRRHARYFLALVEEAEPHLDDSEPWKHRLAEENDNLRAALNWTVETGEVETGLRIASALKNYWHSYASEDEGRERLRILLSMGHLTRYDEQAERPGQASLLAKALNAAGYLTTAEESEGYYAEALRIAREVGAKSELVEALRGLATAKRAREPEQARAMFEEALSLSREIGDRVASARSLIGLATLAYWEGDFNRATTLYEESLLLWQAIGSQGQVAHTHYLLGLLKYHQRDYQTARVLLEESLRIWREIADRYGEAMALGDLARVFLARSENRQAHEAAEEALRIVRSLGTRSLTRWALNIMGEIARSEGDYSSARTLYEGALEIDRALGRAGTSMYLHNLAHVALHQRSYDEAHRLFEQALRGAQEQREMVSAALCLAGIAGEAAWLGAPKRAATLFAAANALLETKSRSFEPSDEKEYHLNIAHARAQLSDDEWEAASTAGRAMTTEQAITYALEYPTHQQSAWEQTILRT